MMIHSLHCIAVVGNDCNSVFSSCVGCCYDRLGKAVLADYDYAILRSAARWCLQELVDQRKYGELLSR